MSRAWPKCMKCRRRVDLKARGKQLVASCCGKERPVRPGYVPADTEPFLLLKPKKQGRATR